MTVGTTSDALSVDVTVRRCRGAKVPTHRRAGLLHQDDRHDPQMSIRPIYHTYRMRSTSSAIRLMMVGSSLPIE